MPASSSAQEPAIAATDETLYTQESWIADTGERNDAPEPSRAVLAGCSPQCDHDDGQVFFRERRLVGELGHHVQAARVGVLPAVPFGWRGSGLATPTLTTRPPPVLCFVSNAVAASMPSSTRQNVARLEARAKQQGLVLIAPSSSCRRSRLRAKRPCHTSRPVRPSRSRTWNEMPGRSGSSVALSR